MALTLASEKSVEYLKTLFEERFGGELPTEQYEGLTQAQVSGSIKRLLQEEGILAPTPEQLERVSELATALGMKIQPGKTLAACNRQIRSMERTVNANEYRKGASNFDAFLATLAPAPVEAPSEPTREDDGIPF